MRTLIIADLTLPSNVKRLWAVDVASSQYLLLVHDLVAHGAGSDVNNDGVADAFSNVPDSRMSSPGLYRVAESYLSDKFQGIAYRLDGLSVSNSNSRERAIVLHPSAYVRPGHVGRSWGCPAVRPEVMAQLTAHGLRHAMLWIEGRDESLAKQVRHCLDQHRQLIAPGICRSSSTPFPMPTFRVVSATWAVP